MMVIGCDHHPGFQQIAFVDTETGECGERRLQYREEAEKFYRDLAAAEARFQFSLDLFDSLEDYSPNCLSEEQFPTVRKCNTP